GPATKAPPGNDLPASLDARLENETNTPCSSAMSRTSRSQRATLDGPGIPSSLGHDPRASAADQMKIAPAPSRASSVPVRLCQASSQMSTAQRPQGVSNARNDWPRSTNRSSSNSPYVGRKF